MERTASVCRVPQADKRPLPRSGGIVCNNATPRSIPALREGLSRMGPPPRPRIRGRHGPGGASRPRADASLPLSPPSPPARPVQTPAGGENLVRSWTPFLCSTVLLYPFPPPPPPSHLLASYFLPLRFSARSWSPCQGLLDLFPRRREGGFPLGGGNTHDTSVQPLFLRTQWVDGGNGE